MYLTDLLQDSVTVNGTAIPAVNVTGVSCDTRLIRRGEVFFALAGTQTAGVNYADDATAKGAVAVVHDGTASLSVTIPEIRVDDARQAFALACARWHDFPARAFYLIGITGTNGKTTLTYLLEKLLSPEPVGVIGTVNARWRQEVLAVANTTPDATALGSVFARMRDDGIACVAMEVSSHALEQKRVDGLDFDSAVFTNLSQDHLDYHRDFESYYLAKRRLFTELLQRSRKTCKLAVINADDSYGQRLIGEIRGVPVRTFSATGRDADLKLESAEYSFAGTRAHFTCRGAKFSVTTNLIGAHNVRNIMAALLVSAERESDWERLAAKLAVVHVPGRLERVANSNFFVDYAHTPDALENVITALREVRGGSTGARIITVFGCGGDRDRSKRALMGGIAARLADVVVVTSDNPRTEDPAKIVADIMRGIEGKKPAYDGNTGYLVEIDRAKALQNSVKIARENDIVLVAGKGHEDYQIVGTEKRHFDDREILAELLLCT